MKIKIFDTKEALGKKAAADAARKIKEALQIKQEVSIILATGTSQFQTLQQLISEVGIDWSRIHLFHLDEYVGIPSSHPASFRKYLQERFVDKIPSIKSVNFIEGDAANPKKECERIGNIILQHPIDVALVGIGENGHLAFNDPPADFATNSPYIVVDLDEACRRQQMGEGWFANLEAVPIQAISMSIHQIMLSKCIICSVPDERKAQAVKNCLENEVTNKFPASILQQHPDCSVYLDDASAALLTGQHNT
jgi:glucosamine-6-phosphate deaminase